MLPAHGDEPGDLRTKWGRSNVCSLRTGMSLLYVAITRAKKGMLPAHGDEPISTLGALLWLLYAPCMWG